MFCHTINRLDGLGHVRGANEKYIGEMRYYSIIILYFMQYILLIESAETVSCAIARARSNIILYAIIICNNIRCYSIRINACSDRHASDTLESRY